MPAITFEKFNGGLDVRPPAQLARTDILRVLTNAYITTGRSIKKRPCLSLVATLENGTVGLKGSGSKLLTFYGQAATIVHANTLFSATRAPHIVSGASPSKIHYCEQFNALPYIVAEYSDATIRHHYLYDTTTWVSNTVKTAPPLGVGANYIQPTVLNGFRYVATVAGTTGLTEPTWPTSIGSTVTDGGVTWMCATYAINDTNCPHTKIVTKRQQKIYAAGASPNTGNVPFCATANVRDWTTAGDAGFLPAGLQASGSDIVTALGQFIQNLAVFFQDSSQVWAVSANPALNALTGSVENVGTAYSRANRALAGDLFFLSGAGFRSISLLQLTNNLQDQDVGTAIDALIKVSFAPTDDPISLYYPALGQWWCINGATAWVYSFSRTGKLSAWSKFTFPVTIDDATVLNQTLYIRSGNDVYSMSETAYMDGAISIPLVEVEMYPQDANRPSVDKMFMGEVHLCTGSPTVSYKYTDPTTQTVLESAAYELTPATEIGPATPVELLATRIAPVIKHQKNEAFEMSLLSLLYENLGIAS